MCCVIVRPLEWAVMESEGVSSGEDDDGILDEDIPGGDVDNLLDDAELDYTEDILEETDDKHVMNDEDEVVSQDTVSVCLTHIDTHTHIYIHVCMYVRIHTNTYITYIHTYTYIHRCILHAYTHKYILTYISTHVHT